MRLLEKIIKSNTGYNSKTAVMLFGMVLVFLMIFGTLPLIYIAVLAKLEIDLLGIAAIYTSLATLAGVLIYGKVRTDMAEYQYHREYNEPENYPIVD